MARKKKYICSICGAEMINDDDVVLKCPSCGHDIEFEYYGTWYDCSMEEFTAKLDEKMAGMDICCENCSDNERYPMCKAWCSLFKTDDLE